MKSLNNTCCGDGIRTGSIPESNKRLIGKEIWIWCPDQLIELNPNKRDK